jgi:RDD family
MAANQPGASFGKRIEALVLAPLLFVVTLGVGWVVWCLLEWRNSRTPSYRLLGLRVVRLSDEQPIRFLRSLARSAICCLLVIPTIAACCVVGLCFVFGASAPDELFRRPRTAPWDRLTATRVIDERTQPNVSGDSGQELLDPIDLTGATRPSAIHTNGNGRVH